MSNSKQTGILTISLIAVLLIGVISFENAFAQEEGMCIPLVYEEIASDAGAIFSGTVISTESIAKQHHHNIQFEIDELLFGEYDNFLNVTTSDQRMPASESVGGNPFQIGEKYFVMATLIQNNTLYADSSGCVPSLIIPISSGLYGMESSQDCSASVHAQCLERCSIDEYRWNGGWDCFQTCYEENKNQCQLKPESTTSFHLSPLKQITSGILPENVTCKEGLELIFKNDHSPACVKPSTAEKLIQRGWTSP